jgi:hypothetical protein
MSTPSEPLRPIWVSPKEACRICSMGLTVLYGYLNDGTIVSRKLGNKRLVSVASLERLGSDRSPAENPVPIAAHRGGRCRKGGRQAAN